ncbi:hypothetical protein [Streptomyces luteogriseus]|uniref:hypothetical protein n=1 Tax=Streptomyces luteogriseus TaxID=68233 RepID=UPI00371CAFF7
MITAFDLVAYLTITAVLALATGWAVGYRTRPEPRRTWACARCDDAALRAEAVRFNAVIAGLDLDLPDQEQQ